MTINHAPDYPAAGRLRDRAGRRARARRILAVLDAWSDVPLAGAQLLDVGASHGIITAALAERVEWACGLDVDAAALRAAREEGVVGRVPALVRGSGTELPFKDECMDLVVCNHVDVWVVRK